ncbi:MAG: chemotaxis protein CheW [Deltaproteobacteria bacterium]|nr:chemotaxis protein CheW [Deltaproteobacteria bacterium]
MAGRKIEKKKIVTLPPEGVAKAAEPGAPEPDAPLPEMPPDEMRNQEASAAWLAIPVDDSAIQTYHDAGLTVSDREGGAGGRPTNATPRTEKASGTDATQSFFPLEETIDSSDASGGGYGVESLNLLCMAVASETFGIDIRRVMEIIRARPATELPGVSEYINGIISLRGAIVPVLDLRRRLGFERDNGTGADARIVVLAVGDKAAGILVDAVSQKIRLPQASIVPPPAALGNGESGFLLGVCRHQGRLISVLDPEKLLGIETAPGREARSDTGAGEAA